MSDEARVVRIVPNGPVMVQGPVRIEMPDGTVVESDRFMCAICTCRPVSYTHLTLPTTPYV